MGSKKDLTGQQFGMLRVLENTGQQEKRYWLWKCRCECSNEILVNTKHLKRGTITHCGCQKYDKQLLGKVPEDLSGKRYGRLTVLKLDKVLEHGKSSWLCQCDCGNQCVVSSDSLHYQKRKSCGCLHREAGRVQIQDLTGQVFGKLTVMHQIMDAKSDSVLWKCRCECGNEIQVLHESLLQNAYKSCGCVRQKQQESLHENLTLINNTCIEVLEKRKHRKDNTSGFRGVSKSSNGKWMVTIGFQGKRYYIGLYSSLQRAIEVRRQIEDVLHNDFIQSYKMWKKRADDDQLWAEENPFFYEVKKAGNEFHIHTVFKQEVVSVR